MFFQIKVLYNVKTEDTGGITCNVCYNTWSVWREDYLLLKEGNEEQFLKIVKEEIRDNDIVEIEKFITKNALSGKEFKDAILHLGRETRASRVPVSETLGS